MPEVEALTSLTDLTARTATADSDLLHINSGGTDYKETKANFLRGDFAYAFDNTTTLTSQVDALTVGSYFGTIASYGHQSETGVPANTNYYVQAFVYSGTVYRKIILQTLNSDAMYIKYKYSDGSWSGWVEIPTRSEITSLNNSVTKSSVSVTPVSGVTVSANSSILVDGIVILNIRITTTSVFSAGSSLLTVPAPKTTLSGGSGTVAVTTNNKSVAAVVSAQGQLAVSTALSAGTYILSCVYEKA